MAIVKFNSSAIESLEFQSIKSGLVTFDLVFNTGVKYRYSGVPEDIFTDFLRASSKGQNFHDNIKNKYKTTKM